MPRVRKRARSCCNSSASNSAPSWDDKRRRTASGEVHPTPPSDTSSRAISGARMSSASTPLGRTGKTRLGSNLLWFRDVRDVLDLVPGLRSLGLILRAALVARLVQIRVLAQLASLGASLVYPPL